MALPHQKIQILVTDDEIKHAIQRAQQTTLIDNLRTRHINIQFDSKVRGFVGEIAIEKWLNKFGITIQCKNSLVSEDNMDIDFLYKGKNIELKTSLVPDSDITVDEAIVKRDIKLIKRQTAIEDLKGDIHLQIFFQQKARAKDLWLKQQAIDYTSTNLDYLFEVLAARAYRASTYFVGWIDKETLVSRIKKLETNNQTWNFAKRDFWRCALADSNAPIEIISYLQTL